MMRIMRHFETSISESGKRQLKTKDRPVFGDARHLMHHFLLWSARFALLRSFFPGSSSSHEEKTQRGGVEGYTT